MSKMGQLFKNMGSVFYSEMIESSHGSNASMLGQRITITKALLLLLMMLMTATTTIIIIIILQHYHNHNHALWVADRSEQYKDGEISLSFLRLRMRMLLTLQSCWKNYFKKYPATDIIFLRAVIYFKNPKPESDTLSNWD